MRRTLSPADVATFRERVCKAATDIVNESGAGKLNMRALASRMGVSAMTAYRYFQDKDEILAVVRAEGFARFAARLADVPGTANTVDEVLAALARSWVAFARAEPALYAVMFDASLSRGCLEERRACECFAVPLHALADSGICRTNPDLLGQVLWWSLSGAMEQNLSGEVSEAECDRRIFETIRLLCRSSAFATARDVPGHRADDVRPLPYRANAIGNGHSSPAPTFPAAEIS